MNLLKTAMSGRPVRTNHAMVVNEIGHAIISGVYQSGAILPNDAELAERFDVSRTVLREAMKTLTAMGLVVPRARVGTRVTDRRKWNLFDADVLTWHFQSGLDADFLNHLFEMRIAFEPSAARLAAEQATENDIQILFEFAEKMRASRTNESFALADLEFHLALLEASKNPFMYSVGSLIEAVLGSVFELSSPASDPELTESVALSHRRIAEAIEARDPDQAARATHAVITVGRDRIMENLRPKTD
jgi:DNA-binding FadR family transcriptional regulator